MLKIIRARLARRSPRTVFHDAVDISCALRPGDTPPIRAFLRTVVSVGRGQAQTAVGVEGQACGVGRHLAALRGRAAEFGQRRGRRQSGKCPRRGPEPWIVRRSYGPLREHEVRRRKQRARHQRRESPRSSRHSTLDTFFFPSPSFLPAA